MVITFNKIELKNFMSFEDSKLVLNKDGYIMVSGQNENPSDNAKSNGAGKSTIFEAIIWCLTGETMRGTKDVKRFGSSSMCSVKLNFKIDNNEYELTRTKDPTNLTIIINGENKSGKGIRDSQKLLEEYLPDLSAQLIGSVIIMGQGLPMRFSNNSPSGRKEALEKLSRSDFMVDDLKNKVNSRKTVLSTSKRKCEDDILTSKTIINTKSSDIKHLEAQLNILKNINYDADIKLKSDEIDQLNSGVLDLSSQFEEVQKLIETINFDINELYRLKSEEQQTTQAKFADELQTLRDNVSESKLAESELRNELNRILNIKTHCPTCGQELKGIIKPDPTPVQEKLVAQQKITSDITRQLQSKQNELQVELNGIGNKYFESENQYKIQLQTNKTKSVNLKSIINSKSTELSKLQSELKQIEIQKSNHSFKISQTESSIISSQEEINKAEININQAEDKLADCESRLEVINKFDTALKRDFRGILLGNIINYIDKKAKEYSSIVFETDKLDFKLDGNNISILYDNKDYTNLSGGEKQRVDLIIQFALRDMLCKYLNFSSNILVLDEIVDNLDSVGCQKVMELMSMKLNDVGSIYIISHHADLPMPSDYELTITKNKEGVSYVTNSYD